MKSIAWIYALGNKYFINNNIAQLYMKNQPTRAINYGIAFVLFAILIFSLLNSVEGFKEGARKKDMGSKLKSLTANLPKPVGGKKRPTKKA